MIVGYTNERNPLRLYFPLKRFEMDSNRVQADLKELNQLSSQRTVECRRDSNPTHSVTQVKSGY